MRIVNKILGVKKKRLYKSNFVRVLVLAVNSVFALTPGELITIS